MANFQPGLVHTPVTPFKSSESIDFDTYAKLIEFHIANRADALAVTMHAGESVALSDAEQRKLIVFALKQVNGRVPVIAHASDAATGIAVARARFAQDAGAAAIVATTPYYWTPPAPMVLEHLRQIGAAVTIPYYVYFTPDEIGSTKVSHEQVLKLIDQLPNFAGLVDASRDWQFMINVITAASRARTDFQLASATDYMVSSSAIGARCHFSPLAGVVPKLVRHLYDLCQQEQYPDARPIQEQVSALIQVVKKAGVAGLKGAVRVMGRDCGKVRLPNTRLSAAHYKELQAALGVSELSGESRGW